MTGSSFRQRRSLKSFPGPITLHPFSLPFLRLAACDLRLAASFLYITRGNEPRDPNTHRPVPRPALRGPPRLPPPGEDGEALCPRPGALGEADAPSRPGRRVCWPLSWSSVLRALRPGGCCGLRPRSTPGRIRPSRSGTSTRPSPRGLWPIRVPRSAGPSRCRTSSWPERGSPKWSGAIRTAWTARRSPAAAIESVARHSVDGVIGPLICAFLFGPMGAFLYKAIDALDSAFGHKNEQYYDFGRFAAWLDRLANWLPARVTVWFMALAAMLLGMRPLAALRISRRDGATQQNPNATLPEAAMAGGTGYTAGGDPFFAGAPSIPSPSWATPCIVLSQGISGRPMPYCSP